MNFSFTEEQEMLRDSVRSFLAAKLPIERTRELMETDTGFDAAIWAEMAALGWMGMAIPEEYGGFGFTDQELNIVVEEMGRTLAAVPFFSTAVLGANAVLHSNSDAHRKELLPRIASGELRVALAHVDAGGTWDPDNVDMTATKQDDGWVLNGTKAFVIDGHTADVVIATARSDKGVSLFVVDGSAEGLERRRVETMDMTRKQAELTFSNVRVQAGALAGAEGGGDAILRHVLEHAITSLACEQVGGAQMCLEMSVEYAKVRVQFGRAIGSFQAIKHKCADMLMNVESARSTAYYASWAAAAEDEELAIVAPLAKSVCSDAYFAAAADTIQIHGGIGFTWEHDAHLYFKRAKTSQLLFGDPVSHRRTLADQLGL